MNKRIFLLISLITLLICLLSVSVGAEGPKDLFSEVITVDSIGRTTTYGYGETDFSRVVLVDPDDSTKYYTYPTYYIFDIRYHNSEGNQPKPTFDALNTATGRDGTAKSKFSNASIVCIELPEEFTGVSTNYTRTHEMTNLEYIKFPKTFKVIHSSAFKALSKLSLVEFESNTDEDAPQLSIGSYAFDNCDALVSVALPVQLKAIGERGFGDNDNLESVTFAEGTDFTIYNSDGTVANNTLYAVFINDKMLKSIVFPKGITSTGYLACGGCTSLEYVYIPASCKAFDGEAFKDCKSLKTIEFAPNSQLETIGAKAISESSVITSLTFPNTFLSAGGEAPIRNLSNLTYINFGASFTSFTGYASMYSTTNKNLVIVLSSTFDVAYKGELSSSATILYTGSKEQAAAFVYAKTQSYDEWVLEGSPTNDVRFVYGYNVCTAFYNGNHDYTYEGSYTNDCVSKCGRCGEITANENPNHNNETVITYENGFLNVGLKVVTCQNADCGYCNETAVDALIIFVGVSTNEEGNALCFGYTMNNEEISEFVNAGNTFRYGVVAYAPGEDEADLDPVTSSVAPLNPQRTIFAELNDTYSAVDFVINGFNKENADVSISMCAFIYDGTEVDYVNASFSDDGYTVSQDEYIKAFKFADAINSII